MTIPKTGRLNHCDAFIDAVQTYRLTSYHTIVCDVSMDDLSVVLYPSYDCSITTMQHVRRFLEYFDITLSIPEIRKGFKHDSHFEYECWTFRKGKDK